MASSNVPDEFLCPITMERMEDPVLAPDGFTYERQAIEQWLQRHDTSPKTGSKMPEGRLIKNRAFASLISAQRQGAMDAAREFLMHALDEQKFLKGKWESNAEAIGELQDTAIVTSWFASLPRVGIADVVKRMDKFARLNADDRILYTRTAGAQVARIQAASFGLLGNDDNAIECLDVALRTDPRNADLLDDLALIYTKKGLFEGAVACAERALAAAPSPERENNCGVALQRAGRHYEALQAYHRARLRTPADADMLRNIGDCFRVVGRLEDALREYDQSLQLRPGDAATAAARSEVSSELKPKRCPVQ